MLDPPGGRRLPAGAPPPPPPPTATATARQPARAAEVRALKRGARHAGPSQAGWERSALVVALWLPLTEDNTNSSISLITVISMPRWPNHCFPCSPTAKHPMTEFE